MDDDLAAAMTEAEQRGQQSLRSEPRAKSARYDRKSGRIVVELTNGCSFAFPARRAEGLEKASDAELSDIEILGLGFGLHWERLDVDLSVPGLLAGIFGTKAYMDRMRAARAGAATSPAKAAAARRNGAKGGRPQKTKAAAPEQQPLIPLAGTGRGLWGKNSTKTIRALRDEWER